VRHGKRHDKSCSAIDNIAAIVALSFLENIAAGIRSLLTAGVITIVLAAVEL
jgi:hypothetical protein